MISNNERMRIRRQMQRRIRDVVAERRRARQLESPAEPAAESTDPTDNSLLTSV
ncbi:hypothetical protein AB0K04_20005 [Micromonospora coxensis]|uniref:Uncharacterized protein n=1 Tax=Micromonospora coxensis TaxID=356852 RepID=A0A1C5I7X0_9ACTN|nr:hypothetical protein [Micromonospora coxensis]SCG53971.1 hypothetical protein GA0070614_2313 [Micromonospora coxensis]